ncbi:MAG: DoxX family protein [Rhodothermales bacterium]|nr:DoxX family protein [Rhodothermales bacterium]MBO6778123.1 DoxX family protein [Rhodothermales bacterium]
MSATTRFLEFGNTHNDAALDIIRTFLGFALFVRGVLFIADADRILALIQDEQMSYLLPAVALQIAAATHLLGGLMLSAGLLTRLGALIQIPVLLGAVYISAQGGGLFLPDQSLELSVLVLFVLGVLFVFGSGKLSVDNFLFKPTDEKEPVNRATSAEYRARVREWESEHMSRVVEQQPRREFKSAEEANLWRLKMVVKYGAIAAAAAIALIFLVQSLPFEVTVAEIGAVGGALFMILAFFFLFFGWALRDVED